MKYINAKPFLKSFTCPNCGTLSKQEWRNLDWDSHGGYMHIEEYPIRIGTCDHCNDYTLWVFDKLLFPDNGNAPFPNPEMPKSVFVLYIEAASYILSRHEERQHY